MVVSTDDESWSGSGVVHVHVALKEENIWGAKCKNLDGGKRGCLL